MGMAVAFGVGWSLGARLGTEGFHEIADAAKAVRATEEYDALVAIARSHGADVLMRMSKLVSGEVAMPEPVDLLARVKRMTENRLPFSLP